MSHFFITTFKQAAESYGSKVAFKIPIIKVDRVIEGWRDVTYGQFYQQLDLVAKYWLNTLKLPYGSIVALWMSGMPYSDLLHIYAVMRAGYVPHILFSEVTNLDVMRDLFNQTGAAVIIQVPELPSEELSKHIPCFVAPDAEEISEEKCLLHTILPDFDTIHIQDKNIIAIVHTSGSTSGRVKVVRLNQRWFNGSARKMFIREESSIVVSRLGSFCHIGQLLSLVTNFKSKACTIMVPWINLSTEDIIKMYDECGLNALVQYAPFLSDIIKSAQQIPELTSILQSFLTVYYTGAALSEADVDWCKKNKIPLETGMGMTETGILMATRNPPLFHLLSPEGCAYKMVLVDKDIVPEHIQANSSLSELVVLSSSLDCPDVSLRHPHDGHFHTKDLFEEVTPGGYLYRGRLDDILFMKGARKLDTKYIEEQVYHRCQGLISICVIAGAGKPSPALLVEPASANIIDVKDLIRQVGEKVDSINERGLSCERITPDRILVLQSGELPRTAFKNNVNRVAAEMKFRAKIDALYA